MGVETARAARCGIGTMIVRHTSADMSSRTFQELLATGKLPTPTGVALQILDLVEDPDTTAESLARVIECDPALSGRMLKIANSPLVGSSRQIASVFRAVVLLGFRSAASIALGVTLVSGSRTGSCKEFDYDQFWSNALARGVAARHIVSVLKNFAPDEAFTCGLLSQVGRVAMASAKPEVYSEAMRLVGDGVPLHLAERELVGIDHDQLTSLLLGEWHMPGLFREAVLAQGAPDDSEIDPQSRAAQFATVLHLSGAIADVITDPAIHVERLAKITREAYRAGIRPDRFYEMFDEISSAWSEAGHVFEIPTTSSLSMADIYTRVADNREAVSQRENDDVPDRDARGAA